MMPLFKVNEQPIARI